MTWRCDSSRHPDPKAKAAQQRRHNETVHALAGACEQRDPALIARILAADVELVIDSGDAVSPLAQRAEGARASSDLMVQILEQYSLLALDEHPVNGAPGILLRQEGILVGVLSAGMQRDTISHIWVVLNPDKLVRFDLD